MVNLDEKWELMVTKVVSEMRSYIPPFLTPIAKGINYNLGKLHGTGSFWELNTKNCLLTCEHVACEHEKNPQPGLSYLPHPKEQFIRCSRFVSEPEPKDLALFFDVKPPSGGKKPLKMEILANDSETKEGEVLFICGFPEKNSTPSHGQLYTRGLPYCTQKCPLPACGRFLPQFHFAIHYPASGTQNTEGESVLLPDPYALSGSPVWSSEFVRSGCSQGWRPEQAKIIGIAWCWSEDEECLVVTKVEAVRCFLDQALQKYDSKTGEF